MIQSMTGFGSAELGGFRIEIRSLNHRFMDISIKCHPVLNKHEMALRDILKSTFSRGKFDVYISFVGQSGVGIRLNRDMVNNVFVIMKELKEELDINEDIGIDSLLSWKELFIEEEISYNPEELFTAFSEALKGLEQMRIEEGNALALDINSRIDKIEALTNGITSRCPEVLETLRGVFTERLTGLFEGIECDDNKIIQEAAALAEKCDIMEEVVRLKGHISHIRNILSGKGAVGRKMDFLVQELNREANTVASKAADPGISKDIVDMKAEIERVREQVQNVQ